MKPIPTEYNGIQFRSRLEARWAVFFDAMGYKWEYERHCFDAGDAIVGGYIPDFHLPDENTFVEVKPVYPSRFELEKMRILTERHAKKIILVVGAPDPEAPYYWRLEMVNGHRDETAVIFKMDGIEPYDFECPRECPPPSFEAAARAAISAKFDGFDNDRAQISRRYQ